MVSSPSVISITLLLLSIPILFLLAPHILPPRHIPPDDVDDINLLHQAASLDSRRSPSYPSSKSRLGIVSHKPKVAFLFLTNSDLHFAPLWERFFNQSHKGKQKLYNIYIHADPFSPFNPPGGVFKDRLIPSKKTYRASPTLISAARRLLATALLDDPANAFFAIISQYCVPLHSFKYAYRTLFAPRPVKVHPGSDSTRPSIRVGRQSFIEILSKSPSLWDRYTARGRYAMLPEVTFDRFRVGSQFFVLTRRHALVVVKDHRLWRKFRLPCSKTESCYPEEHYFPTLLSMEDPDGCTHFTLTRVNWTGSTHGHPHTYRPPEVSAELIYTLRTSNSTYSYLFARKFSPDCLEPLMGIADSVIFRD